MPTVSSFDNIAIATMDITSLLIELKAVFVMVFKLIRQLSLTSLLLSFNVVLSLRVEQDGKLMLNSLLIVIVSLLIRSV